MRRLDELYLECPFYGSRRMAVTLGVNCKRAPRRMGILGIKALYPKLLEPAGARSRGLPISGTQVPVVRAELCKNVPEVAGQPACAREMKLGCLFTKPPPTSRVGPCAIRPHDICRCQSYASKLYSSAPE